MTVNMKNKGYYGSQQSKYEWIMGVCLQYRVAQLINESKCG